MTHINRAISPSAPVIYGKRFATDVVCRFLETYARGCKILAYAVGIPPERIHRQLIHELQHSQLKWRSWKILIKQVQADAGIGDLLLNAGLERSERIAYLKRLRYMADDQALDELQGLG
jgi:hypothetical protein